MNRKLIRPDLAEIKQILQDIQRDDRRAPGDFAAHHSHLIP